MPENSNPKPQRDYTPAETRVLATLQEGEWQRVVPSILSGEVDINLTNPDGKSLVAVAIEYGRIEAAGWLVDHGADLTIRDRLGWEPIHEAAQNAYGFFLEILLQAGAKADALTDLDSQAIHFAGWTSLENSRRLLDAGVPLEAADKDGKTLADIAHQSESPELTQLVARYAAFPKLSADSTAPLTKAELFATNGEGYALLDNPNSWQRFDEITARLALAGEELTTQDLLKTNFEAKNWLQRAAECRVFGTVLEHLNQNGESVGKAQLIDAQKIGTPLLSTLIATGVLAKVMEPENWNESVRDLREVYSALPQPGRAQLPNWHSLQAWVSRNQPALREVG